MFTKRGGVGQGTFAVCKMISKHEAWGEGGRERVCVRQEWTAGEWTASVSR